MTRSELMAEFFGRRDRAWSLRCKTLAEEQLAGPVAVARALEIDRDYHTEVQTAQAEWTTKWNGISKPGDM